MIAHLRTGLATWLRALVVGVVLLWSVFAGHAEAVEPKVATGWDFTAYLAPDGTVWTWGDNSLGQLGQGDTTPRSTPTRVPGLTNVISIATGFYHVLALKADGTVVAWGYNAHGQIGQGITTTSEPTPLPVAMPGGAQIQSVACGGHHSFALGGPNGTVYAWGYNSDGQLGKGNTSVQYTPIAITGNFRSVSGGWRHSLGIATNGVPYAWGDDSLGQLGDDAPLADKYVPTVVSGSFTDVVSLSAGRNHSLMALSNGLTYAWGDDTYGQLGNGAVTGNQPTPYPVNYYAWKVVAGNNFSMFLYPGGYVYAFGDNSQGQCQNNPSTSKYESPVGLGWLYPRPNEVVGGLSNHIMLTQSNGALMGWGDNSNGQLGIGSTYDYQTTAVYPSALWSLDTFIALSAGNAHTLALKADGTVWAWGSDNYGQLGDDGTLANKSSPVQVSGMSGVIEIAAGSYHSLALTTSGQVYAWGWDYYGQLGNDTNLANSPTPVSVPISGIRAIGAGAYHSLAVYAFGGASQVRAWGANGSGQLGDATNTQQPTPVSVSGLAGVWKVEGGYQHSVALMLNGSLSSWGADYSGQLGNNATLANSNVPVSVGIISEIDVAAGQSHSTSVWSAGYGYSSGADFSGQQGNGLPLTNQPTPGQNTLPNNIKKVSAGADYADFSVYLARDGTVYSCGADGYGQLGNDVSNVDQPGMVQVAGLSQICAITAGDFHAHALAANGTLYSWGYNGVGQLGNGSSGTNAPTPIVISTETWRPTVSVAIVDSAAGEAGPNTGAIRFTRSSTTAGAVTVNYSLAGSAVNGTDYSTLSGVAVIPANSSFVDVILTPIDDNDDEDNESADISLSTGTQYRVGSPSTGSITITDNDTSGFVISTISANTQEADAAGGVSRTFTVRLATRPSGNVVLNFASSNTAEGLVDTNSAAGYQGATTLTFDSTDWNNNRIVEVFGRNDDFDDGDIAYFISIVVNQTLTLDSRYDPLDPPDVSITNIDNDTAAVVVSAVAGSVTEAGGTTTFTITLASRPYNPVSFTLSSSDTTEGVLGAGSNAVTIDPTAWNTGATITIQGVNDDVDDGNQAFKIDINKSTSSDPAYNNLGGWDVPVTCIDDDTKGVTIDTDTVTGGDQSTPIALSEGGSAGQFSVRLNSQPTAQVTLTINTPASTQVTVDTDQGTVGNQNTLTFTTANWNIAQIVRVTAVDDATIESSPHVGTILSVVNGGSGDYSAGVTIANVTCNITDNDTPGFIVSPSTSVSNRQITTESGGTASFTVRLRTQPAVGQTVSLRLNTNDLSEGRIANQPIVVATTGADGGLERFTFDDNVALSGMGLFVGQTVTVLDATNNVGVTTTITAVQTSSPKYVAVAADITASGPERIAFIPSGTFPFIVTTNTAQVAGSQFNLPDAVDVLLIPLGSSVLVTSTGTPNAAKHGLVTSRSNTPGSKNIGVNLVGSTMSNSGAEKLLLAPPTTLTFTNGTWNIDQTVTVTGQDDLDDETLTPTTSTYGIEFAVDTSSGTRDTNYDSVTQSNQFMRNQDDDVAGVRIVQEGGATIVDEANLATTDTYRVRLNTAPAAGKVVVIQITPDSQLSVNKSLLVFTAGNYSTEQVVTVTAVDDNIQESSVHTGTITHTIDTTLTDDATYGAITDLDEVTASIADNDSAGIVVSPTIGLVTTEAGFASSFTVVLTSQPTANVTIDLSSSNTTEGTVSPSSLTFTPANWYIAQSATVTGVNDFVDDGDVAYVIATDLAVSADTNYDNLDAADVLIVNADNDAAGVTVTQSAGSTAVTEGGVTPDTITVVLTSQPASGNVIVTLSPGSQLSLSSSTLTFTTGNWSTGQTVNVSAVNDNVAEGAHSASLGFSASGVGYSSLSIPSVNVSITDNDTAGTTVSATAVTTTEAGGTGTFTFRLNTQPTANVTVVLASNDTTEGTVSPSSLTFTPGNFSTDQTVTVTGVNDDVDDGNIAYGITFTLVSADPAYNNLAVTTKSVTNTDNDTAGFTVSTISNALREDGTSGRFTVRLTSEPTAAVTIGVAVSDATEASVSAASLTFDANNWNEPQEVTVSGVDDSLNDGDIATTVVLSADTGTSDVNYLNLNPADVAITTQDDDQAGFAISTPTIVVAETAGVPVPVAFTVQLLSQPTADVTIAVSSSDLTEATVDVSSVTFTSTTWNVPQTITVTPVDDFAVDGTVAFTVVLGAATSSDTTGYSGLDPNDVNGSTTDNDSASFTLSATTATTSEGATTSVIQVVLTSQPSANVTLMVTGLDTTEGSLSATPLVFTPTGGTAWNVPQNLTITGVNDALDDGDQNYTLTLTPTSGDSTYNALSAQTITVTNSDNDAAAVVITEIGGTTVVSETGATDTYTIQLASQPLTTATITVTPDSQVLVNGSAVPIVLTFDPAQVTPAANGWNTVRTITVSAVVDTFDEANPHAANITHTVANYVDQTSVAVTASPVAVTVNDNDPPQATVTSLTVGRGGSDTITSAMISATDDDTAAASLVFTVILAPGQGDLWLDYGQVGQDLLINGDTFTQAAITANRLSYHNSGTPNVSDGFAFRVSDAVGNQGDLTIFNITVTGFIPPIITLNGAYSPSYTENDPPVAVDTAPSVSDPDSATYSLLTISQSGAGMSTDDQVFFASTGPITASSGTILYSGTPIGTYTGGTGSTDLTVTFSVGAAGDAQLTNLLTALRYRNTSEDPVAGVRTISLVLRDDSGTENVAVTKNITVLAINDPPVAANATVITPKNVAVTSVLTIFDVDNYPLTVQVITPPGKGTLSGLLDVLAPTTLADALSSRAFTYTPSAGQEGVDSFTYRVTDPDGAQATATVTVLIVGGAAARPWIVSDAPVEAEAGDPLSYDIVVDFANLPTPPTLPGEVSFTLVGTLPAGVTFGAFTPNGTNATLTLTISSGATGVIEAGIVVTETASNTSGYQPLTIVIVPPGSLGN